MVRLLLALALAVPAAAGSLAWQTPARSSPLVIDAVVVDRDGMPVMDLRQDEIEVWIAGYRVPIETFIAVTPESRDRAGRIMALLLDDMSLPPLIVTRGREVARRFVTRMLPEDRLSIVSLNTGIMDSSGDPARMLKRIENWHQQVVGVMHVDTLGAHILGTVEGIARNLAEAPGGRKTVVAIGSAGLLNTPIPYPTAGRDLRREWTAAMRAASRANVALYVIDPTGVGSAPPLTADGLAAYTGGHAILNTNELQAAADRVLREASNYYLMGVPDPPVQRKADLRDLDVKVLRSGLTVRARRAVHGTQ